MVYTTETYMLIGIVLTIGIGILFLMAKRKGCSIRDLFRKEYNIKFRQSKKKPQKQPQQSQPPYRINLGDRVETAPATANPEQVYRKITPVNKPTSQMRQIALPEHKAPVNPSAVSEEKAHDMLNGEYYSVERSGNRYIIRQENDIVYVANSEDEFHGVMEVLQNIEEKIKSDELSKLQPKEKIRVRKQSVEEDEEA